MRSARRQTLDWLGEVLSTILSTDGCGCQGCLAVVFFALVVVSWVSTHRYQVVHGAFALGVATAFVVVGYVALTRLPAMRARKRMRELNPSSGPLPLASVRPGQVHTAGLVGMSTPPIVTPFDGHRCVFYQIVVTSKDTPHAIVYSARSAEELVLEDGGGAKLLVKLDGATWSMSRSLIVDDGRLDLFLFERGIAHDQRMSARVEWIEPHELVFVRGVVTEIGENSANYRTSQAAQLVMTSAAIALDDGVS